MGFAYKDKKSLIASKTLSEIIDELSGGQLDDRSAGIAMDALQLIATKGKFSSEHMLELVNVARQYPTALTRVLMVPRASSAVDKHVAKAIDAIAAELPFPEIAYRVLFSVTGNPRCLGLLIVSCQRRDERAEALKSVTAEMVEVPEIKAALIKSVEAFDYNAITASELLRQHPTQQAETALKKASKKSSYPELMAAANAALAALGAPVEEIRVTREERLSQLVLDTFEGIFDVSVGSEFRPHQDMEENPEGFLEVLAEAVGLPVKPFIKRHMDASLGQLVQALIDDPKVK